MTPWLSVLFVVSAGIAPAAIVCDGAALVIRRGSLIVVRSSLHSFGKLFALGVFALGVGVQAGPEAVLISWTVAQLFACGFALWKWRSAAQVTDTAPVEAPTPINLKKGFVLQLIGTLAGSLPPQVLPLVVVASLGTTSAAWFSITWLVGGLCFMISPAVSQTLLAEGTRPELSLRPLVRSAALLSLGLLAVPVLLYVGAGKHILDLFGSEYGAAGSTLLLALALSSLPDLVTNLAVSVYRIQERLVLAAVVNCSIAAVAIAGTVFAVSRHSLAGIGWSWCAGQGCGVIIVVFIVLIDANRQGRFTDEHRPSR